MVVAEPVDNLAERRVVGELETVPQRPLHSAVLILRGRNRLREPEERQGEVDEAVLVVLKLVLAVNDLDIGVKIVKIVN